MSERLCKHIHVQHAFPIWNRTSSCNAVLCPSPGCQIRVRVITSESESESSPQSPSPSPSHHLRVRVRVRVSESKKCWVRVTNLVVHIFNICLSSKTWKQTTKCIECQSKQRKNGTAATAWTQAWLGPESRVTISESESESKWKKLDSSASPSKLDSSPSSYSSHTALM